jgi:hypothetical protein
MKPEFGRTHGQGADTSTGIAWLDVLDVLGVVLDLISGLLEAWLTLVI